MQYDFFLFCCRYKKRIKEVAAILTDEPMSGLERAIWWTEYVIRHKGAGHLKSPWATIPWYQYLLLDVLAFVLFCFVVVSFISYKILYFVCRLLQAERKFKLM